MDSASDLTALLAHVEEKLNGDFLAGDSLSLADVIVKCTLDKCGALSAALSAYSAKVGENAAFAKAQTDLAKFSAMPEPVDFTHLSLAATGDGTVNELFLTAVTAVFTKALHIAFPEAAAHGVSTAEVTRCSVPKQGDYQCNSAMGVFGRLKGKSPLATNPRAVAQAIVDNLPETSLLNNKSVVIAGPGFINCRLKTEFLQDRVGLVLSAGVQPPPLKKQKVAVDFSSPNIAKEMHVGHLRSTIIGDTVCRLLEFCNHEVLRINHVGDWGTQFGMLICHLQDSFPDVEKNAPNLTDLTAFYKGAKKRFDEEPEFKARAQLQVTYLQSPDPKVNADSRKLWNLLCDISRKEFDKVYDRLGVTLEEFGESFYNPIIPGIIDELEAAKKLKDSDGATCMFVNGDDKVPLMLRKSNGGFGYDSTDMAAVSYRLRDLKCDWVIYITDAGQADHFKMVFKGAEQAGWKPVQRLDHIGFGVVCGDDGKRFKTRSGATVRLVDLLDAARDRMEVSLAERVKEGKSPLPEKDVAMAAEAIGYGAVKYFDLKQNPSTNYIFNYDKMLDTRGDTAVYLLQQHARICSIISKSGCDVEQLKKTVKVVLEHDKERELALELCQLGDVISAVLKDINQTHRLCDFLYQLATKFSEFFTNCKCIDNGKANESRILLCEATAVIMRKTFSLLGIKPLMQI